MTGSSTRWVRLDLPGRDVASVRQVEHGYELRGRAESSGDGGPYGLDYVVTTTGKWETTRALVRGRAGGESVSIDIARQPDATWYQAGAAIPEVTGCIDVDLGFTPVTNLLPIRRLELAIGQRANVRSAWLATPGDRLRPLEQVYRRISAFQYEYQSRDPDFAAVLTVSADGFVTDYPGLWVAEIANS